jgi:hypothetical protein
MSLSDCEKCWDTPCTCGWDYREWTVGQLEAQIKMLLGVLLKKTIPQKIHGIPLPLKGVLFAKVLELADAALCNWRLCCNRNEEPL